MNVKGSCHCGQITYEASSTLKGVNLSLYGLPNVFRLRLSGRGSGAERNVFLRTGQPKII